MLGEKWKILSCSHLVAKLTPLPPWTVLYVRSQTLFTYFVYAKDLNFVRGGGVEGNLVKAVFMSVYRRLAVKRKTREKEEVSQNLLARIVAPAGSADSLANSPRPRVEAPAAWKLKSCTFMFDQSVRLVTVARSRKARS